MSSRSYSKATREKLRNWADSTRLNYDAKDYCDSPEANLPWLTTEDREAFQAADGNEFGSGGRAKISALHSSSALALNFFGYWNSRPREPLAKAIRSPRPIRKIRFEVKFPTKVGPRDPNLDVVVDLAHSGMLAIESKFLETFTRSKKVLPAAYLKPGRGVWAAAGLPGVQAAAESLGQTHYEFLDAPQLLKHLLGLGSVDAEWRLLLLWYAPSRDVEGVMSQEAAQFKRSLGDDGDRFDARTYQDLWRTLEPLLTAEHEEYREYMRKRYFS